MRNHMYAGHDPHIHYNLANGYASLYYLTERNLGVESIPRSANLQKAKEHLRDALRNGDESRRDLRKQIFANLCRGAFPSAPKMASPFLMATFPHFAFPTQLEPEAVKPETYLLAVW